MKKLITLILVLTASFANAQAYKGKGDIKAQVGANFQDGGTGLVVSADFGIGENMSYGFVGNLLLNAGPLAKFEDKVDLKARFNANIGNVIGLDEKMDIYPGLSLGLRNLGAHTGFRYFFTDGFGVFAEAGIPIAYYGKNVSGYKAYNNQFTLNIGASFNL
jgi:hypothetical protein